MKGVAALTEFGRVWRARVPMHNGVIIVVLCRITPKLESSESTREWMSHNLYPLLCIVCVYVWTWKSNKEKKSTRKVYIYTTVNIYTFSILGIAGKWWMFSVLNKIVVVWLVFVRSSLELLFTILLLFSFLYYNWNVYYSNLLTILYNYNVNLCNIK